MLAFENLGVSTAMPIVADDLDGVALYGWTFTAALLGSLIGIAVTGTRVDRMGPGKPYLAGLALFSVGLIGAGAAPTMPFLVGARFVQGLGVGAVPAVVYAAVGRVFDERARARVFALLSTAWVVPGLVGPAISGTVAETIGWRWVFFGVLPLVPLNALLTAPSLLRLGPPPVEHRSDASDRHTVALAIGLAASAAFVIGGLNAATPATLPLVIVGVAGAVIPLRKLLPAGTFTARAGIPAAIATRGMTTLAFFTAQAFLPLTLKEVRGQPATFAGFALTLSTLTWTAGAWLQDRRGHVIGRHALVVRGLLLLVGGVATTALVMFDWVPVWVAVITWSVGALGMGLVYGGLSLIVLAEAPEGQEGRASSAMQLSEQVSVAMGTGLAGAAVAAADRAGDLVPGLVVAYALSTAAAIAANVAARRMKTSATAEPEQLVAPALGFVPDALDP